MSKRWPLKPIPFKRGIMRLICSKPRLRNCKLSYSGVNSPIRKPLSTTTSLMSTKLRPIRLILKTCWARITSRNQTGRCSRGHNHPCSDNLIRSTTQPITNRKRDNGNWLTSKKAASHFLNLWEPKGLLQSRRAATTFWSIGERTLAREWVSRGRNTQCPEGPNLTLIRINQKFLKEVLSYLKDRAIQNLYQ